MIIPFFLNNAFVELQHGYLTQEQQLWLDQFIQTLNAGLSNNGWTVPNLSTADITTVAPSMPLGTIWYDSDVNKLKVKTGNPAVIEQIASA